jgi:acetyl-CoA C-acetyltransferase
VRSYELPGLSPSLKEISMQNDPIVIVSVARTPMGAFQGELKGFAAPELGAAAIRAAVERAGIRPDARAGSDHGLRSARGQGQAPARQASLGAGLPLAAGCTTVNKMCGSGMKAAMFAHDLLATNSFDVVVAGGMESMTNAPYLLPKARSGLRMGHGQVIDHMFYDGLEDAYDRGRLMAPTPRLALKVQLLERSARWLRRRSLERAQKANREGWFAWETTPIAIKAGKEDKFVETTSSLQGESREDPDAQARRSARTAR